MNDPAPVGAKPPEKLNHHHEAIIDLMLSEPEIKKGEIAERLGYTLPWVSVVTNSDTFKVAYRQRRAELHSQINDRIVSNLSEIDRKASERILTELSSTDCSPEYALKAKENALKNLGYGVKPNGAAAGGSTPADAAVSPEQLQAARQIVHDVQQYYRSQTIEGEAKETTTPGETFEAEAYEVGSDVEMPEDHEVPGECPDHSAAGDTLGAEEENGEELPEGDRLRGPGPEATSDEV